MKFRYLVVDLITGSVVGFNDEEAAKKFMSVGVEEYYSLIDLATNEYLAWDEEDEEPTKWVSIQDGAAQ